MHLLTTEPMLSNVDLHFKHDHPVKQFSDHQNNVLYHVDELQGNSISQYIFAILLDHLSNYF